MPTPTYINIEYFFYKAFIFLKEAYFFTINLPWGNIISWSRAISTVIVILFAIGIIYNLVGIARVKRKEEKEL